MHVLGAVAAASPCPSHIVESTSKNTCNVYSRRPTPLRTPPVGTLDAPHLDWVLEAYPSHTTIHPRGVGEARGAEGFHAARDSGRVFDDVARSVREERRRAEREAVVIRRDPHARHQPRGERGHVLGSLPGFLGVEAVGHRLLPDLGGEGGQHLRDADRALARALRGHEAGLQLLGVEEDDALAVGPVGCERVGARDEERVAHHRGGEQPQHVCLAEHRAARRRRLGLRTQRSAMLHCECRIQDP
ncbi:hypothetical protein T484DRAFT_2662588 [Baffinella frigidus]|nr:hypothetical protein T484DRAFT_2662588 [Cryptophyta sp. CCMP2293]